MGIEYSVRILVLGGISYRIDFEWWYLKISERIFMEKLFFYYRY